MQKLLFGKCGRVLPVLPVTAVEVIMNMNTWGFERIKESCCVGLLYVWMNNKEVA